MGALAERGTGGAAEGLLQHFREVERVARAPLRDLLATAESARDHERRRTGPPDRRQKDALADPHRHIVMLLFEAERASHAAASRVDELHLESHFSQLNELALHVQDRLVVTMPVHESTPLEPGRSPIAGVFLEQFAQ